MTERPPISELAARVMQNENTRLHLAMHQARFLVERGWENAGAFTWVDWLTGQTYPVKRAYHIELQRGMRRLWFGPRRTADEF